MSLKTKRLDPEEEALAVIMTDPVLFAEFMRSTKDGSMNPELWTNFKYRWYQKDIITDKSPFISAIGGRAIGKCLSADDRLYTNEGYRRHSDVIKQKILVWAKNEQDTFELRRAYVTPNGKKFTYYIRTQSNYDFSCTKNHPIYTLDGYKFADDIRIGDLVAVATKLPHPQTTTFPWHDVRLLGYLFPHVVGIHHSSYSFNVKSKKAVQEIREIATKLPIQCTFDHEHNVTFKWRPSATRLHPIIKLITWFNIGFYTERRKDQLQFPREIMQLNEENMKTFLESYFSIVGKFTSTTFTLPCDTEKLAVQLQEILLRFGIETQIKETSNTTKKYGFRDQSKVIRTHLEVVQRDYRAFYRFWNTFSIPNYTVGSIPKPPEDHDVSPLFRFEPIVQKDPRPRRMTYAVHVEGLFNYIAENVLVHNSLTLEDRMLFQLMNPKESFGLTKEMLFSTANESQMAPVVDKLNSRILASPLLRNFTKTGLNKQERMMKLTFKDQEVRFITRIAGNKGESNVVGLHVNKAYIDESQLYPRSTYTQLTPTINVWEEQHGIFTTGVPNSLTNTTLYQLDKKSDKTKKYRVPAPNNPYFSYENYLEALRLYGGEQDDRFQNLVLGRHGTGSLQVITRDQLDIESYTFNTARFSKTDKDKGKYYKTDIPLPILTGYSLLVAGIDTGFVDPTIISIFGLKGGKWYYLLRIRLQRIEYPEQEEIIHWLHKEYKFAKIGIDIGSGGGGAGILQSLTFREEYKSYHYDKILLPVQFSEGIVIGYRSDSSEIKQDTKTLAAQDLVRYLTSKQIVFSEVDNEAISEIERITKKKNANGSDHYYIMSEEGSGKSEHDHIFASFLCFIMVIRDNTVLKRKKKIGKSVA